MSGDQNRPLRVLLLTERRLLADMIKLTLTHGIYVTRDARTVGAATALLTDWRPHLVVVDLDNGGDQLLRQIAPDHMGGTRIPILALTRRGDLTTKLAAFDQGVDDIMTIPLAPEELLSRVLVITRHRLGAAVVVNPVLKIGEIEIDILNRKVRAGTEEVHLTGLEQSLLYLLVANAGQTVTREDILDALWGVEYASDSNIVDRHVSSLRAKLHDDWQTPRFIATLPGRGYRFVPGVSA